MKKYSYPVVILAGGLGTRLREETEFRPKPMVPIGGKPILWHIMKIYAYYGFYRFIICLGYKGDMIKQYFLSNRLDGVDFTINTKTGGIIEHQLNDEDWEVTLVDTGQDTMTGARIKRASRYIDTDRFLLTYGDGLADINIEKLMQFHTSHSKLVTLTGVTTSSRFGYLELYENMITSFSEKKALHNEWINGGFFVCERNFLSYLSDQHDCILEQNPLKQAAANGELIVYKHNGYWQCMDTYREHLLLEDAWKHGAPWKLWLDNEKEFTPATQQSNTWQSQGL